jgi:hypothetical protein
MTETNSDQVEFASEEQEVIDPIESIGTFEFASISGRADLVASIGRNKVDGSLQLALVSSSGNGVFCKDYCSASAIQDVVLGEGELTAKSFHVLHAGRSINTGGFILAALRELGLIRPNEENTRVHEHVPGTTFEKVVSAYMAQAKSAKEVKPVPQEAAGRKTLKLKAKEG